MSLALARKYRPNLFEDLIGQESISQTLSLALDSKRLSHAYLFSGLRGSGKTSTARIFAKALLCENGETSTPCNKCANCLMANENRHMDIVEMDAASNRGIDDIKELIEHTKYRPSSGRYKIFIIDEVHMLTTQAHNALLKTLEEPPSFVKFILATTDPLKIPSTILSRTQHFRFKKIPEKMIFNHLEHILNLENIEYEKEALEIIARTGAGSLRDSLTLLDQAIVYSKNFVDVSTITHMLGIIEPSHLKNLISSILLKDNDKVFDFIALASEYETEMILDELSLYIKDLMFAQDKILSPLIIERFFRVIAGSKELLKMGSDGTFVLSLTFFKMMESLEIRDIDTLIKNLEKELHGLPVKSEPAQTSAAKQIAPAIVTANAVQPIPSISQDQTTSETNHSKRFEQLIQKIYDRDYMLGSCFDRTTAFNRFEDGILYWHSSANEEDKDRLRAGFGVIKKFANEIFGSNIQIKNLPIEQGQTKEQKIQEEKSTPNEINKTETLSTQECQTGSMIEEIEMSSSSCMMPEAANEAGKEKDPSSLLEEPMVKEAIELFNPSKVRVIQKV